MSISVGLEGVRADKRLLIVPALFFLSPFVTAAVPRLTWLFLALIAIALGVRAWRQGVAWRSLVPLDAVSITAVLVAAYVSINALWAADQGAGFAKAALLWGLILVTIAASTAIAALDERQLRLAALGFAAGAALGAVYVLIEMLTDAAITRAAMNAIPSLPARQGQAYRASPHSGYIKKISLSELNQNVTIVMLSLWPALSVLALIADRHRRRLFLGLIFVVTALGGRAVRSTNPRRSRWSYRWSLSCWRGNGAPPSSALSPGSGAWPSRWSCRSISPPIRPAGTWRRGCRIRPGPGSSCGSTPPSAFSSILGSASASNSTHNLNRRGHVDQPQGFVFPRSSGEHAHNLFLQTWYELGLIGAILLALAGAAIALRMLRLPKDIQPFAAASFAAFFGIAAFAWSIWQTWFMCAIGLLILYVSSCRARAARGCKPEASHRALGFDGRRVFGAIDPAYRHAQDRHQRGSRMPLPQRAEARRARHLLCAPCLAPEPSTSWRT